LFLSFEGDFAFLAALAGAMRAVWTIA